MRVNSNYIIFSIIAIYATITTYLAYTTPLIPAEAKILYSNSWTISHYLAKLSHSIFGGIFGLRLGFLILSIVDIYLFFIVIRDRFKNSLDTIYTLLLFIALPGSIASSVLASDTPIVIFITLLSIIFIRKENLIISVIIMATLLLSNSASFAFYLAIALYALNKRDNKLAISAIFLFIISILVQQYPISGKPQGHFIELLGIYAAVFSPLLFIYYFYALYRSLLEGKRDILWYISFTALALSLLLSIRQKIRITDFSPYLIIGIVIAVEVFLKSLRVRMRRFQFRYRFLATIVIIVLIGSSLTLILNRPIYYLFHHQYRIFISPIYDVYNRANEILKSKRECYREGEFPKKYERVIKFYGLKGECGR